MKLMKEKMEKKNRGLANCRVRVKQRILASTVHARTMHCQTIKRLRCAVFGRMQIMKWTVGRVLCQKHFAGMLSQSYYYYIHNRIPINFPVQ